MTILCFVGTYRPIMCGIADYTEYLVRESLPGSVGVLSFHLSRGGFTMFHDGGDGKATGQPVWHGIPGRREYSASDIIRGLDYLGMDVGDCVLWFQHENGIWQDDRRFVNMLRELSLPTVVTFHSLHFQSAETSSGLRKAHLGLLEEVLTVVNAVTVFSQGVKRAVAAAYPELGHKVHVLRHGIHAYPDISGMSRHEARLRLEEFLLRDAALDPATREALDGQAILREPTTVLIGQTGFLCPSKNTEVLYTFRDRLQEAIPNRRIAAIRIGSPREEGQKEYARRIRSETNGQDRFLAETWLPPATLPLAQRAFDINLCWPSECTQSGVLAHALGAGAVVAGRELEGVGETLREAGQITDTDLERLVGKVARLIRDPVFARSVQEKALAHAARYSWERQARAHRELAGSILRRHAGYAARSAAWPTVSAASPVG